MKILITGGAGFMGSNAVKYFLKNYPHYKFVKGDIADEKLVDEVVKDVDVIINYAAETHVDRSILNPKAFITTDFLGTYSLLEAAKKYNIKKYIQISTDEVFGSIQDGKFREDSPF